MLASGGIAVDDVVRHLRCHHRGHWWMLMVEAVTKLSLRRSHKLVLVTSAVKPDVYIHFLEG